MTDKLLQLETIFVEYIHLVSGKTLMSFTQKVSPEDELDISGCTITYQDKEYKVLETIREEGKVRHNMKEVAA